MIDRVSRFNTIFLLKLLLLSIFDSSNGFTLKHITSLQHRVLLLGSGSSSIHQVYRRGGQLLVRRQMAATAEDQQPMEEIQTTTIDDDSVVDQKTLQHILNVAIDASKKAGSIILGNADGAEITKNKANSRDLLTLIDPLCEKTIRETVLQKFPDHDFLGEEDVPPGKEASIAAIDAKLSSGKSDSTTVDWLWIVDPIDGTTNFVHGMPLCMPSVAAAYKGKVMVGVIYDPHRDEIFTATRGNGAFMNGKPISVGEQDKIGDAIVAMGSPPGEESMEMSMLGTQALMPKVRTLRMLGSAAIMLAWVANGRLTAYWEYDLSSWDISAGALIIQEAGGDFTDLSGNDFTLRTRKVCASNGKIHQELLKALNDVGID